MVYEDIADPFRRLVRIMERLQEPGGCPWDLEQTHESLKPYLIEEAYETLDAIDSGDDTALAEELGDVLLQVVFHSTLARRTGRFTIDDVSNAVAMKMVRRHPHVFGETEAKTAEDVLHNWEKLKTQERKEKAGNGSASVPGILDGVPKELPALLRAQRIQQKASRVGFDWTDVNPVLDKIAEETFELKEALAANDKAHAQAELGDLLFTLVNVARFLDLDAEEALRETCNKFQKRFSHIERSAVAEGRHVHDLSMEEMDARWNEAKSEDA
jgi:tetrapyrrole methylase family protein/MazG family protein